MSTNDEQAQKQAIGLGSQPPARTIAVVASELQDALLASAEVKILTAELHALLGKKKRGPRAKKAV